MQILRFRVQNLVFARLAKAISNRRYSHIIPAHPCQCRFSNFVCKTWCFDAFPKPFQIEDMHIHYSCPALPVQILQFCVQNLVFSCLPKAIANRRYSHILFLPTPCQCRFSNLVCKTWCFHAFPKPFQIEDIHIFIPAHPCQCRFSNFVCKTWCFHAFPKPLQIEDIHIISHTLFLPTPASADSPISCAKLGVFMPS